MLTYEEIIQVHPRLADYPRGKVEFWARMADVLTQHGRFHNPEQAKLLYVAHAVVHTEAPIVTQAGPRQGERVIPEHHRPPPPRTPQEERKLLALSAWGTTKYGHQLARLAKY